MPKPTFPISVALPHHFDVAPATAAALLCNKLTFYKQMNKKNNKIMESIKK
jgi:hypothetical protein